MATTPNYSFSVYSSTDTDVRFLDFRVATAGSQSTSNFYVIDTVLKQHSDAIDSINATPSAFVVKGTYSSGSLYTASVANYPGYKNEQLIVLSLNQKNTGAVQININGTTNKDVMKYGSDGVLKAVDAGDFVANSPVLCLYDGTRFVVIGITSASSITVTGEAGDILQIADDGTIESSGKKAAQPNGIATLDENGNVVQVANMANSAAAVYSGEPVTVEYAGANRIASITAYGENAQGGTTEAPVALTGISSITVNDDVTELPIPRPLRRVGDVKDKCVTRQDYESAEKLVVTYNVGFVELDGTENWVQATGANAGYLEAQVLKNTNESHLAVSSIAPFKYQFAGNCVFVTNNKVTFGSALGSAYTVDTWKAYLAAQKAAGTPVQVAYHLATPEVYATDPVDFDNTAGPLTVVTGGQVEVKMTDFVTDRTPAFLNKLDKTGDGSDVTVTFTEATEDADIASSDKLSILFGKILKRFSTITSKFTTVEGDISDIVDGTTTVANATTAATADKVKNKLSLLSGGGADTIIYDGSTAVASTINSSFVGAEPAFTKNSAFNKNFGSSAGTVCQGNDGRLSNARRSSNITMSLSGTNLSISYS